MRKCILVVEDHPDVRAMMKTMVETSGHRAIEARDGYEAVIEAREHSPDLILMDLAMPVLDGAAATRKIKKLENCSDVPVVAVTAYNHRREEALNAGCIEVIAKPVELTTLQEMIDNILFN